MSISPSAGVFLFADRRSTLAFWTGSAVVSIGVILHLPMFWMARHSGFILAGMPMDGGMLLGMALIVGGIALWARTDAARLQSCLRDEEIDADGLAM